MFLGTLFIIVKIGKQPKCPSRAEWMKKMWCIHTHTHTHTYTHQEYYTAVKKRLKEYHCSNKDVPRDYHTK